MQAETHFDRATLDRARYFMRTEKTLEEILQVPALAIVLKNVAKIRMKKESTPDVKKLQSNDHE